MDIFTKGYLRVLGITSNINNERNRRIRYFFIAVFAAAIFGISFLLQTHGRFFTEGSLSSFVWLRAGGYGLIAVIGFVLLSEIVFLGSEEGMQAPEWNKYFVTLWCLECLLIIFAGISHDIGDGYVMTQFSMLVCLPGLVIAFQGRERLADLYDLISYVIVLLVLITAFIQLVYLPYIQTEQKLAYMWDNRYMGLTYNPNRLGEYAVVGIVGAAYLAYRKRLAVKIVCGVATGVCICEAVISVSRTAILSCAVVMLAWLILSIKGKVTAKHVLLMVLAFIVGLGGYYGLLSRAQDPMHLMSHARDSIVEPAHAAKEKDGSNDKSGALDRFLSNGDLNDYSSGRLYLWRDVIKETKWSGNDVSYKYPLRVKYNDDGEYQFQSGAHNVGLEFAFRCGWPAGIIFWGIELWGLVFCIAVIFGRRKKLTDEKVFAVFSILAFIVMGNLEQVNEAFVRVTLLVYYLALLVLFVIDSGDKMCEKK